jgi:hypothetical protein
MCRVLQSLDCGSCGVDGKVWAVEQHCAAVMTDIDSIEAAGESATIPFLYRECCTVLADWYEGYPRDHWQECSDLLSGRTDGNGANIAPDTWQRVYGICKPDNAPAWSATAKNCQVVFSKATDTCDADGVPKPWATHCTASVGCLSSVHHVIAMHEVCAAHGAEVWPLEADQYQSLNADSCVCEDHELATYLNPELHPETTPSFTGYTCSQLVAEDSSRCHHDASMLSPSLVGLLVGDLCCSSCGPPSTRVCEDSTDCPRAVQKLAEAGTDVAAACPTPIGDILQEHNHWTAVTFAHKCAVTCNACAEATTGCWDSYDECEQLITDKTCFGHFRSGKISALVQDLCRKSCDACCVNTGGCEYFNGIGGDDATAKANWCRDEYRREVCDAAGQCTGECEQSCNLCPAPVATGPAACQDSASDCENLKTRYECVGTVNIAEVLHVVASICPATCDLGTLGTLDCGGSLDIADCTVSAPDNGRLGSCPTNGVLAHGSACTVACDTDYVPSATSPYQCIDGTVSAASITCTWGGRATCWDGDQYTFDRCCDTAKGATGDTECWSVSDTFDTCLCAGPVHCNGLSAPENGERGDCPTDGSLTHGAKCTAKCVDPNYSGVANLQQSCYAGVVTTEVISSSDSSPLRAVRCGGLPETRHTRTHMLFSTMTIAVFCRWG